MEATIDRVRNRTADDALRRIEHHTLAELQRVAHDEPASIDRRLAELEREWDTDRAVEAETAFTGLCGVALALARGGAWWALPAAAAGAMLLHARTGRHPWMPLWRRLGLRTAGEIARERQALKLLRGDFAPAEGIRPEVG